MGNLSIIYSHYLGEIDMVTTLTEMTRLWDKTLKNIKARLNGDPSFDYFFGNSYIYDKNGSEVTIVASNKVAKAVIQNKYIELVTSCLNELEDDEFDIKVVTEEDIQAARKEATSKNEVKVEESKKKFEYFENSTVNPKLTFDSFVVGDFNKDAHKASLYVAKNGGSLFNPLFIYSHSGLGKTHLLHAIGNEFKSRVPDAKVLYIAANDFVEAYIKFVKGETESNSLKDYFKDVDILLFDDVQFMSGKVKTEEMFFYVYQQLINSGKRIIITSDRQPNELKGLEDRLITRFTQGLTVKINEPDTETCVEILKKMIVENGLKIEKFESNVIYFLAETFSRDVRELQGALNALMFDCINSEDDKTITLDVAMKAVSAIKGGKDISSQITEQKILNAVADYYNIPVSEITGKGRNAQVIVARHLAMYLIRNNLDVPLKRIGEIFGGRDHTTVMSAITKVDKELKTDEQLSLAIKDLEAKIKE